VGDNMSNRKSISPAGAPIPNDFYVADWNSDGVQDLILKQTDGQLIFRKGLPAGGFTNSNIGNGWNDFEITIGKWKKTDPNPSIIAKHLPSGELYNYPNRYGNLLDPRVGIGAGWGPYTMNLMDWDRNGNIDIVARHTTTNEMLLYRTDGTGGFLNEARPSIGSGWSFDSLHTVSGRAGAGSVGLLARISGDLYYYPANTGSWGARTLLSGGWSSYKIAGN
jgi:hypothetical protein